MQLSDANVFSSAVKPKSDVSSTEIDCLDRQQAVAAAESSQPHAQYAPVQNRI